MKVRISVINNILGAFADGAILFPLMALLTMKAGFSGPTILFTTGFAYLVSSFFFRIPMSVQPLKSIAVAAITVGATFSEVRVSGFLLGLFCITMIFFNVDSIAKRVPESVIHQLQLGLGILLIFQGLKSGFDIPIVSAALFILFIPSIAGIPLLGLIATIGLLMAVFSSHSATTQISTLSIFTLDSNLRLGIVASLLLPQLALTMTNSVLATKDVAVRVFGKSASRVTIRSLLSSIGFGNVVVSLMGGMPFCHGSGGLTAHIRGGSTKAWSTGLIGIILLVLSGFQYFNGSTILAFPPALAAILLVTTGFFHLQLAKPTARASQGRIKLVVAAVLTIATRNLLIVLTGAIVLEIVFLLLKREVPIHDQLS